MSEGRVLILDDDPAVGETVRFISEVLGFEARALTDPIEFLEVVDGWPPTHIVLDLVMPRMDGVEIIRCLAERKCPAHLVLSSGVGGRVLDAARRTARAQGLTIVGVLPKPFSPAALRALLHTQTPAVSEPAATAGPTAHDELIEVDEKAILQGLHNREFRVVYQPIVNCATGTIAGFEALARWEHSEGTIMPIRFIQLAESLGLINRISRQVLRQAASWMASAHQGRDLSLSVNISAACLADKSLADDLEELCLEVGLDPGRLIVELTESAAMAEPVSALELLTRLRMKGFQLSIDDFGTGYSSLAQLSRMPFSELKVDKSFVITAAQSPESRTIIHSIVDLAHNLDLRVVAEGVEEEWALEFLRKAGCDYVQGYHIARPMSAERAEAWASENLRVGADSRNTGPSAGI